MIHTPEPWHVDAYGCHNDYKLRLCEPMRSGFPLATIAQFQYNWRDAGQYDRQISYKEAEANVRRAAACVNALQGFSTEAIEAGGVQELVEAAREAQYIVSQYRSFLETITSAEFDLHPYIPSVEDADEKLLAELSKWEASK